MSHLIDFVRRALIGYEPVAVRAFATSLAAALALGGIGTGALPGWAEMALAVAALVVPVVLGFDARAKVTPYVEPPAETTPEVVSMYTDEPDEDPEDDFADVPGKRKRQD